jgi:uncharacterized membrane protein (UPF0182 family)
VIVATNEEVIMRPRLAEAIAALTGSSAEPETPSEEPGTEAPQPSGDVPSLAAQALQAYQDGQTALAKGDWAAYGEAQARLQEILEQIVQASGATATPQPDATPVATT